MTAADRRRKKVEAYKKQYQEWLRSLMPGDHVEIHLRDGTGSPPIIDFVNKTTPSQIVVGNQRFWKNNPKGKDGFLGMEIGGERWRMKHMIHPANYLWTQHKHRVTYV